jgi:hypothetical protein
MNWKNLETVRAEIDYRSTKDARMRAFAVFFPEEKS